MNILKAPLLAFGNAFNTTTQSNMQTSGLPLTFAKSKPDVVTLTTVGKITGSTQNDDENEGNDTK